MYKNFFNGIINRSIIIVMVTLISSCAQSPSKKKEDNITMNDKKAQNHKEWFDIKVEESLNNTENGKKRYSEIFTDIEYVPLETTSESLIGGGRHGIQYFTVTSKIIVVDQKIFDRKTGRYLGDLLRIGQGPGEYIYPDVVAGNDERQELYLHDGSIGKMLIADYKGKYKESLGRGQEQANNFKKIYSLGNSNILITRGGGALRNYRDNHQIINLNSKSVINQFCSSALNGYNTDEELFNHEYIFKRGGCDPLVVGEDSYWSFGDKVRFYDFLTDSIYSVGKDLSVIPIGVLGFANMRTTAEQFADNALLKWYIMNIFETSDHIIVSFRQSRYKPEYSSQTYLLTYSKKDRSSQITTKGKDKFDETDYENDIDKGISNQPVSTIWNENAVYSFVSAEAIKGRIEEEGGNAFTTEAEKKFKAMADTLQDDDNHVLAIYHFR